MQAITVLLKPASGSCNLRCKYCFYADEMEQRQTALYGKMSLETAENIIKKTLAQADKHVTFAFQGGEQTLAGLEFYIHFVELATKHQRPGQSVHYALQTNGTLLTPEWARFFHDHQFLIGLSLDGPRKSHDRNRGAGTWSKVMAAVSLLKQYKVEFNLLTVVTAGSAARIKEIYQFYKENRLPYQQYIPCIDPFEGSEQYSLTAEEYGRFLIDLFDLWYDDVTHRRFIYIRMFENLVGMLRGYPPESCDMGGFCSIQYVYEADGSVYPCDFYALDEWRLGNINTDSYEQLDERRSQKGFIEVSKKHPQECLGCQWDSLCRNGCRRDRIDGKNRYCAGFKAFYEHAYPKLKTLI